MNTAHELIRSWPSTMDSKPDADKMNQMRLLCIDIQDERDALLSECRRQREEITALRHALSRLVDAYGCENQTRDAPIIKDARAALARGQE